MFTILSFRFDDPIFRLATTLKPEEVKTTSKKILIKPESRACKTTQYYEDGADLEAEIKDLGLKEKTDSKGRRRVKTDFYDPDTPTKTEVRRVRTKAELKQEPLGCSTERSSFKVETTSSEIVKSELEQTSNTNSHINQPGISLPCFPAEMAYNPMAQVPFTGVPWMIPNLGLMANPLNDPLMMYPGIMQGMVSPFLPPHSTGAVPSSTHTIPSSTPGISEPKVVSGTNVSAASNNTILSENMHEHLLSSTAAEIRRNKKRRKRKSEALQFSGDVVQSSNKVSKPVVDTPQQAELTDKYISDAVALEHSYTIPPHAAGTKRKSRKTHAETNTYSAPHSSVTETWVQSAPPQSVTVKEIVPEEANTSPKKSNKRCPTIKQLLEKPSLLSKPKTDLPVSRNVVSNTSTLLGTVPNHQSSQSTAVRPANPDVKSQEYATTSSVHQALQPDIHKLKPTAPRFDTGSHIRPPPTGPPSSVASGIAVNARSDKPRLAPVPSITHAIEMVKLQQQGALAVDATHKLDGPKSPNTGVQQSTGMPVTSNIQKLPMKASTCTTTTSKACKSEIISKLTSPPMVPVPNVQLQTEMLGDLDMPGCKHLSKLSSTNSLPVSPQAPYFNLGPAEDEKSVSSSFQQTTTPRPRNVQVTYECNSHNTQLPPTESCAQTNKASIQPSGTKTLQNTKPGKGNEVSGTSQAILKIHDRADTSIRGEASGVVSEITNVHSVEEKQTLVSSDQICQQLQNTQPNKSQDQAENQRQNVEPTQATSEQDLTAASNGQKTSSIITTQVLQQALAQLRAVSSVAIPPKVADLVLPGLPSRSLPTLQSPKREQTLEAVELPASSSSETVDDDKATNLQQMPSHSMQEMTSETIVHPPTNTTATSSQAELQTAAPNVPSQTTVQTSEESTVKVRPLTSQTSETIPVTVETVQGRENVAPYATNNPVVFTSASTTHAPSTMQNLPNVHSSSTQAIQMLKEARPQLQRIPSPPKPPITQQQTGVRLPAPGINQCLSQPPTARTKIAETFPLTSSEVNNRSINKLPVDVSATTQTSTPNSPKKLINESVTEQAPIRSPTKPPHRSQQGAPQTVPTAIPTITNASPGVGTLTSVSSSSPPKVPKLSSPFKGSHRPAKEKPTLVMPNSNDRSHKLLSPKSHQKSVAMQHTNQTGMLSPGTSHISGSEAAVPPGSVFANPQLSQAFYEGMNQAFNAQLMSQMTMSQFGGLQHQMPGVPPLVNPFLQEPLLQANLGLMSQVQHSQMLGSPLTNIAISGGLPVVDTNLLGMLQYGTNLISPTGMLSQPVLNSPMSQTTTLQQAAIPACSKAKNKSKKSHNIEESQQHASEHEKIKDTDLASKNSDPTGDVATTSKSNQLDSASHLKNSMDQSKNSGLLPGSKLDEKEGKCKNRSESQDSNSTASDGTADSESPVSTPTTTSVPGWFGKGLNLKKGRRKRQK